MVSPVQEEIICDFHQIGDPARGQWTQVKMKLCTLNCQLENCNVNEVNMNDVR